MIDIHTHILPGLDDGARTMDESIGMARAAMADGITCLAATPHDAGTAVDYPSQVEAEVAEVRLALQREGLGLQIVVGSELYAEPNLVPRLRDGQALTLGGSRYFLLEFPLTDLPLFTSQLVFEAQVAGFVPIVAHPARNAAIQRAPNQLYDLVERGVLAQVTSGSLTGLFGPQVESTARTLVEHCLVHVIASDAHDVAHRSPRLSEGVKVAAEIVGWEAARDMVMQRPKAILLDQPVAVEPPQQCRRRGRWFWFS